MELTIGEILNCTKGILTIGDKNKKCTNYSKDTRNIKKGDTYIGIKGQNFDGTLFWKEAFEKGADTVIINKIEIKKEELEKYNNKNIIQVEDTMIALGKIAAYKRQLYGDKLKVIGVTGSVGKTSTKDIIASIVSQKYKTLKTEGNNNNNIGLPFTILKLKDEEVAVIEMGMNHLGEISFLTKIAKPDIAVITNVGTSHIGILGSRENILKAKLEILEGMENKVLIINNDNDLLNNWAIKNKDNIEIHTFGIENKSEFQAEKINLKEHSSNFICKNKVEEFGVEVPISGEHFILNTLCGITVGNMLGLNKDEIISGIKNCKLTSKRMEINYLKNNIIIVNDSYNASYESMKAAIATLANMKGLRKIAVLGDMFELGDFAQKLHRDVGIEIAKNKIDQLFLIGENAKYIGEEAEKNGLNKKNIFYFNEKKVLFNQLKNNLKKEDTVLFKASNGMKLFEVVEKLKEEIEN